MDNYNDLKKYNNKISFKIQNIDKSIVNGLRRIILCEIPIIAFNTKDINVINNTNVFNNEFIANRISLIPPYFNKKETYNYQDYIFKINKKNTTNKNISVTSGDIEIYDKNNKKLEKEFSKRIFPINNITGDSILILILKPNKYDIQNGEEINIEFKGSLDIAKTHSRWCAVSQCVFYNNYEKTNDIINSERNYKKNEYDEPNEFIFTIQTECGLESEFLIYKGYEIIIDKLNKLLNNKLNINKLGDVNNFYQIEIKNEDYTLLEIIQCLIYNKYFRSINQENNILEYIGYYQVHPDDTSMFLKLKFNKKTNINEFINENVNYIIDIINNYKDKWVTFSDLKL